MNYTVLNIDQWKRKQHFEFFSTFEEPFFGVTTHLDCTLAYDKCKSLGYSFFLYYLYQSIAAANEVEALRLRIVDKEVRKYDVIHASSTVMRADETFGFSFMPYAASFEEFARLAKLEITRIQSSTDLFPLVNEPNVVHCSSLPWLSFTSLSHARKYGIQDSCPKISYGKMSIENDRRKMPVSIHAHHALADGIDVGRWFEIYQARMNA